MSVQKVMTPIENFKKISGFFIKQNGLHSDDPYQEICDNYPDFINLLKNYKSEDPAIDYMHIANKSIFAQLEHGFNKCHSWSREEYYDHFQSVGCYMRYWKGVLTEKGGYKFD